MTDQKRQDRSIHGYEKAISDKVKSILNQPKPPASLDFEVDVAASREAEAVMDHLQATFGHNLSVADCGHLLRPEDDYVTVTWDAETPDIPKEQDLTKAFLSEGVQEFSRQLGEGMRQEMKRTALEQLVLLAARTLCSVRQDEPRLKFEPAYSEWQSLHDEALAGLENAVEALGEQ